MSTSRLGFGVALALLPGGVLLVGTTSPRELQGDRLAHIEALQTIEFETDEVTLADVTVSSDGNSLIFTALGHLLRLPIEGGQAEQLTFGPNIRPRVDA